MEPKFKVWENVHYIEDMFWILCSRIWQVRVITLKDKNWLWFNMKPEYIYYIHDFLPTLKRFNLTYKIKESLISEYKWKEFIVE